MDHIPGNSSLRGAEKMKKLMNARSISVLCLLCAFCFSGNAQVPQETNANAAKRAESYLGKMSLEEKIDYIGGIGFAVRPVPTLQLPALEMSDGPFGVRSNKRFPSTTYAIGIGLAATWDQDLAGKVGSAIGKDARARGVHFMLGPGVNIYRSPLNGRNFEYFGEDPFLAGSIAVDYIKGMQSHGVSATIKHFLGNNSEYLRHDSDSLIDERTLREIYLPAVEAAVKQAHVGSIMDSYNFINGQHATQNAYINKQIARKDWGFDGVIMSDWVATYDGVAAANGGLDLEMPTGAFMNRQNLLPAIKDGRVSPSTIDEKIRHILQTAIRIGWLDRPQADPSISAYNLQNHELALQTAHEGMVLLKNEGNLLPLDKKRVQSIFVVGPDAYPGEPVGSGSARVIPFASTSPLQGIGDLLGPSANVVYEPGLPSMVEAAQSTEFVTARENGKRGLKLETFENADLSGSPAATEIVPHLNERGKSWDDLLGDMEAMAALFTAPPKPESKRWSGYYVAPKTGSYEVVIQGWGEGGGYRLFVDDKLLFDNWKLAKAFQQNAPLQLTAGPHKIVGEVFADSFAGGRLRLGILDEDNLVSATAKQLAAKADAVVIVAGFNNDSEGEGADRPFSMPFGQDNLIQEMAAANSNTIVAITSGGNVDMTGWIGKVPAVIEMWYAGEQGGTALAEILFGNVNPSGHLPATFEKRWQDNPTYANYYPAANSVQVKYQEGIFVGYRGYERNKVAPQFPFGFGLSYTTFKFSNLAVTPAKPSDVAPSGRPALYQITFDVTNTGSRAGAEVAQLYVGEVNPKVARPAKELKGFARVELAAGETKHISIALDARSFAFYDAAEKHWHADSGTYVIKVGDSSADTPLSGNVNLPAPINLGVEQ
jgi:beta-glucosidase